MPTEKEIVLNLKKDHRNFNFLNSNCSTLMMLLTHFL